MSKRVSRSREPNANSATALANSVLPTPVGPMNSSDAIGRPGRVSPAFAVASTSTTRSTASACPTTRAPNHARVASRSSVAAGSSNTRGSPVSRVKAEYTSASSTKRSSEVSRIRFSRKRIGRPG